MNSRHRTKGFASLFISVALTASFLAHASALAQQKSRGEASRPATTTSTTKPAPQKDEKAAGRRARAINLLIETADAARAFKDLSYRARIQTLAADALWRFDEASARQIFRRAWEAATEADKAAQREEEEATGVFSNSDEVAWTEARDEVLSRAAARDEKLADRFMRELVDERERAAGGEENKATRRTPWRELSPLGARRLALAYELLNRGDDTSALRVAAPLTDEGVTGDLVEFIFRLSLPIAIDADNDSFSTSSFAYELYRRLAEKAAADPYADANDVLLLSSYFVSPNLLMVVDEKGGLQYRSMPAPPKSNWAAKAGTMAFRAFYTLAVRVLLGRGPVSQRAVNPVQDRIARFVAIGRLLPFFEQAGPQYAQIIPVMRSQLATLGGEIEAARRDALSAQFELTSLNSKNRTDPLAPQLDELARANDKAERDRISLAVVRRAARERLWDRAQRAAYSIDNADVRRAALSFIVVSQIADVTRAYRKDKEDDFESVARFVRKVSGDAPAFASAWGLAQAAVIAARKKDGEAVKALLTEAESYAAREERGSRRQIAAYAVLLDAASRVDKTRAWDFLSELVRAVNSADGYMGDETQLPTSNESVEDSTLEEPLSIESDAFRLDGVFATMARIDFDKTEAEARALTGEVPRAYARIATARAELEKAGASDK